MPHTQRRAVLSRATALSAQKRTAAASVRRKLGRGEIGLAEVILAPPDEISHLPLFEVILMGRGFGPYRLRRLNVFAMREQVNLALAAGEATPRVRNWIAERVDRPEGSWGGGPTPTVAHERYGDGLTAVSQR